MKSKILHFVARDGRLRCSGLCDPSGHRRGGWGLIGSRGAPNEVAQVILFKLRLLPRVSLYTCLRRSMLEVFILANTNLGDPGERSNLCKGGQLGACDAQLGEFLAIHCHDALHVLPEPSQVTGGEPADRSHVVGSHAGQGGCHRQHLLELHHPLLVCHYLNTFKLIPTIIIQFN